MTDLDGKIKDFISVASIVSTAISPDGSTVLYTVSRPDSAFRHYAETLYLARVDGSGSRAVFDDPGSRSSSPRWSPDGKRFCVLVNGAVLVIDAETVSVVAELRVEGQIITYCWGDDRFLWIISGNQERDPHAPVAVGQFNSPADIWTVDIATGTAEKLAHVSDGTVLDISRSFHGESLYYAHRANDIYDAANQVYRLDRKTGGNTLLIGKGAYSVTSLVGCLADNRLVFAGYDVDPHNASYPCHYFTVTDGGEVEKFWVPIHQRGNGMEAVICNAGRDILFREAAGANVLLYTVAEKRLQHLVELDRCVTHLSVNDSGQMAFVLQDLHAAPEVFVADLHTLAEKFQPRRISAVNHGEKEKMMPRAEIIHWQSDDHKTIEGILVFPKNYQPTRKYPLLTLTTGRSNSFPRAYIGSPDTLAARDRFPYPLALLAEQGYMILCANCRSLDYHDYENPTDTSAVPVDGYCRNVLAGIGHVVSLGLADEEQLGIMGWSLGGYLAARLATWPDNRFKVAAIGNAVTDFVSMFDTSNCFEFAALMRGGFWETDEMFERYTNASPIRWIQHANAAVLIQHGTKDPSMPVTQGREFYYALRLAGKTVKMTEYPDADHVFMDPGYNHHATKELVEWVNHYLPVQEGIDHASTSA